MTKISRKIRNSTVNHRATSETNPIPACINGASNLGAYNKAKGAYRFVAGDVTCRKPACQS